MGSPLITKHLIKPPELVSIPPGFGFNQIPRVEWSASGDLDRPDYLASLLDRFLIWELPRKRYTYVIGVDVSSGMGLDRSVIDVLRCGTLTDPDEQVAQFVSDSVDPIELAYYIDPIGRFYHDDDDMGALVAIECNGQGTATQSELMHHCGYDNIYIHQHEDARDARNRYTRAAGWWTNRISRPIMLARYYRALTTVDERTGLLDYRVNSPLTMEELRDFESPGPLWMAEASDEAHDDCVISGAISLMVATSLRLLESEPLSEARRRHAEEASRREAMLAQTGKRKDFQNSDSMEAEMSDKQDPYEQAEGWY